MTSFAHRLGRLSLVVLFAPVALSDDAQPLRIEFGEAEPSPSSERSVLQMWPESIYRKIAESTAAHFGDSFKKLGKLPLGASENTLYGINMQIDGLTVPWAFTDADTVTNQPPRLWIDFDADGDLDDETALTFENHLGKFKASFAKTLEGRVGGETVKFDCSMEFSIEQMNLPGAGEPSQVLYQRDKLLRRGTLKLGDREIDVALHATSGMFDNAYSTIHFDLDGDHTFAFKDDHSPERVRVDEGAVRLFDTSYSFTIDRYGRSMTLTPLAENIAARAVIEIGEPVPAIESDDLDGHPVRLSDYAGKYVLLDFWSVGCGPCVAELPKLVDAYAKFHAKGFEILGIVGDGADTKRLAALRKLLAEKQVPWKQIAQEDTKGPIMRQFRVSGYPTCFLVDQDGTFLLLDARPERLIPYLENLLKSDG